MKRNYSTLFFYIFLMITMITYNAFATVDIDYPGIFEDKTLPGVPSKDIDEYKEELRTWAEKLGVQLKESSIDKYITKSLNIGYSEDLTVDMGFSEDEHKIYTLYSNDDATVADQMRDHIFLETLQNSIINWRANYIDKIGTNDWDGFNKSYKRGADIFNEYLDYIGKGSFFKKDHHNPIINALFGAGNCNYGDMLGSDGVIEAVIEGQIVNLGKDYWYVVSEMGSVITKKEELLGKIANNHFIGKQELASLGVSFLTDILKEYDPGLGMIANTFSTTSFAIAQGGFAIALAPGQIFYSLLTDFVDSLKGSSVGTHFLVYYYFTKKYPDITKGLLNNDGRMELTEFQYMRGYYLDKLNNNNEAIEYLEEVTDVDPIAEIFINLPYKDYLIVRDGAADDDDVRKAYSIATFFILVESLDLNKMKKNIVTRVKLEEIYEQERGKPFLFYPLRSGLTLKGGDSCEISWTYAGDEEFLTILFSEDGGSTYQVIKNDIPADDEKFEWIVPQIDKKESRSCVIRIMEQGGLERFDEGYLSIIPNCDDGFECTEEFFNSETGQCEYSLKELGKCEVCNDGKIVPKGCDDNNECTVDSCNPNTGECQNIPKELPNCQICQDGKILTKTCDDNNECTIDSCDLDTGECLNVPKKLDKCHDCINGEVISKSCPDDGNECTNDCDPVTGECRHIPVKLDACWLCEDKEIVSKDCGASGDCTLTDCDLEFGCYQKPDPSCDRDNSDPTFIQLERGGNTPPMLKTDYQFSPTASSQSKDTLDIDYTVEQPSLVTVLIYDANNNLIRTLISKEPKNTGSITDEWDGRNDTGSAVPDGTYRFIISGVNINNALDTWELSHDIIIDNTPPTAKINVIKADTPQHGKYTVTGTATDENFELYYIEWLRNDVHEHISYGYSQVQNDILGTFDATNLSDGIYSVRLTVWDHAGNTSTHEMPLTIDRIANGLKVHVNTVTQNVILGSEGYLATADDANVWIDDNLPPGSTEIGSWEWNSNITYSGSQSHTGEASEGTHIHYFIHADNPMTLTADENVIQYVYLDPDNPPEEILLQFYTENGDGEHRVYWGKNKIPTGGDSGTSSLYNMGRLPPFGNWVRLKIPASMVGLSKKEVKGILFATYGGKAWWDKTTKSLSYIETQENSWILASDKGAEDTTETVITYNISQNANISVAIYDENNNLIRNLMNEFKAAGAYQVVWDNANSSGNQVEDGRYYFQFSSSDSPIDSNVYATTHGDWSSETVNTHTTITDSAGSRYEISNNLIQKYDASNTLAFTISADSLGITVFTPVALAVDINDNLFITDTNGKIFKLSSDGYYLNELPYPDNIAWSDKDFSLENPNAISFDNNGDILVGNQNGSEILKLGAGRGVIGISNITAKIRVPYENSLVYATVPVIGTASAKGFAEYTVEYGIGTNPTEWTTLIASKSEIYDDDKPLKVGPPIRGNLATWETKDVPIGIYTIRLTVIDLYGNSAEDSVIIEVARVIRRFKSSITSNDGKVLFELPDNAVSDDADLFSIRVAEEPPPIDPNLTLLGSVYELKPAKYQFLKPCTLSMYYTDSQLGGVDENKLKIYRWNPTTQSWVYVHAELDIENNLLSTTLSKFNDYEVYYAIVSDILPVPFIYEPVSPIGFKYITVHGKASPGINVNIYANSVYQGSVQTDEDTGYFVKSGVELNIGSNQLTAQAIDLVGNTSPISAPISVIFAITHPTSVNSVSFKTDDFFNDFNKEASIGDILYIELRGTDGNSASADSTTVTLKSSNTDSNGITIQLIETSTNSGIYHGTAKIGEISNASTGTIGVSSDSVETITVIADSDTNKQDSLSTADVFPPPAPSITSVTHPSLCQNTFEANLDEWSNMSDRFGAIVGRSGETASSGSYSVKLVNVEEGGDFASYIRTSRFDAKRYPIISFDYKIPSNLKLNLVAFVNGMWKEIVFTDDPKTVETLDDDFLSDGEDLYRPIGNVEEVKADNIWHHAEFNLYNILKNDDPDQDKYIVEEFFFADYNLTGWMELVMGEENPAGQIYYIDNFIISEGGKSDNNPRFTISPGDSSVIEYSYCLDHYPHTIPDETSEGDSQSVTYNDIGDGVWYFHARSLDGGGNWGPANHYQIKVDATGPIADSPAPSNGSSSGSREIKVRITDGNGSGVNPDTIRFTLDGVTYCTDSSQNCPNSGGISYDEITAIMTFSPWKAVPEPEAWSNGQTVQASISATDFAGNVGQEFSWYWTVDYSELAGGHLSLLTTQGGFTPTWSPDGTMIAFMSDRENGNQDIWMIEADDYAELRETIQKITPNDAYDDHHPSWSPVDNRIAFVSNRGEDTFEHIYIINADGTGLTQLTAAHINDSHPTWSPDGSMLAFSRDGEIRRINSDGTNETQITFGSVEYYLDPVWAPNGTQIAFTKSLYVNEVVVMNPDGSNQRVITDSGDDLLPAWSRYTDQIIFVTERDETTNSIWIVNSNDRSKPENFINNEDVWWDSEPEQSPVNDNVAFQSTRNGDWNIWIKTQLHLAGVVAYPESFSPNNDGINDTTNILFYLVGGSAQITVKIYDSADNVIATLLDNEFVQGEIVKIWDGTDNSGEIVSDGTYSYKIRIEESGDTDAIEKTGMIIVDTVPPSFDDWEIPEITVSGPHNISVAVSDNSGIKPGATKLQYAIVSSDDETPAIWMDFADSTSGTLDLNWSDYDGEYLYVRAYTEDELGNITYSDSQKMLIEVKLMANTNPADPISYRSATLNGSINSGGMQTKYYFEYGTTSDYGATTPETDIGSGNELVSVKAEIANLQEEITYHYRLIAENESGVIYGEDVSFTTLPPLMMPPDVMTDYANSVTHRSAKLSGTVNAKGVETTYYFEYGTTSDYGEKTSEKEAGVGYDDISANVGIKGLDDETVYHFRLVATNQYGISYGEDTIFKTSQCPSGTYPPASGCTLSTAIHMNDPSFIEWAKGWTEPVQYGDAVDINHKTPEKALGKADGKFLCLGEGGSVTIMFNYPVTDEQGFDFVVFEDSYDETHSELAYVEVSSNGVNFVRFDNDSLTPPPQDWGYVETDPVNISGFAGKYKANYGTPFDLEDLKDKSQVINGKVDLSHISHIRIIDVVGGEDRDTSGDIIYDATYGSTNTRKGFDLDAIGIIHHNESALPGDVNNDGIVDLQDAILALKVIAGLTPPETIRADADVSGDNKIGIEEVIYILRQVLNR